MRLLLTFMALLMLAMPAQAALTFPALTGRVVDDAHILSPTTRATLDAKLADYESRTTNQVVVVTLRSLQGDAIEDYGYQLGRHWAIGVKGKDNGALLIIAPSEHKVRIEVGYGLEGLLTDTKSFRIIQEIILPAFRAQQMEQGVVNGTDAMLNVLGGRDLPPKPQQATSQDSSITGLIVFLVIFLIIWRVQSRGRALGIGTYGSGWSVGSGGGFSGSSGGGGFSGGGGSFGGGGSSGSW